MIPPPEVRYSILRNNIEVPLIPVDQLPFYIQGLPRELTPFRSHQEGWKLIGETQQPSLPFSIRAPSGLQSSQLPPCVSRNFLPPDHEARKEPVTSPQYSERPATIFSTPIAPAEKVVDPPINKSPPRHPTSTTADRYAAPGMGIVSCSAHRHVHPSGIEPNPWKKEFCTHWIRTNSCDFMQQGCKYKHEMPDREKLRELGFAETPKWYREKAAISAGASSWLRPHPAHDDKGRRLSVESPASCAFRPSMFAGRSQSRATDLPDSLAPNAVQINAEIPNLIDLDDSSIVGVSPTPSFSVSSTPGAVSFDENAAVAQASEQVTTTLASLLRRPNPDEDKHIDTRIDTVVLTAIRPSDQQKSDNTAARGLNDDAFDILSQKALFHSRMYDLGSSGKGREENKGASEAFKQGRTIVKYLAEPDQKGERNRKISTVQQKWNPCLRKTAESSAASASQTGLASSQYAASKKSKKGSTPSKDLKRGSLQGGSKDLYPSLWSINVPPMRRSSSTRAPPPMGLALGPHREDMRRPESFKSVSKVAGNFAQRLAAQA